MMEENEMKEKDELFSKAVKAGKRTYFFDVKSTKNDEKYITITESKRRFDEDQQRFFYEKHKIFLYKEDFDKFAEGLAETVNYIRTNLLKDALPGSEEEESAAESEPEEF